MTATVTVVVLGALALGAPAWAHVTVHPESVPAGSSDVELTFRVPNERDDATTVSLQVFFPSNPSLLGVDVLPVPGWSAAVHTTTLATPVQTDDGPVSQIVSDVTWTATGAGIAPGQYEDFPLAAGSVPDQPGRLVFKALQTYSSGEVVRWIEIPVPGQPAPDTPAPVLTLTPSTTTASTGAVSSRAAPGGGDSGTEALAIAALALSGVSLGAVIWLATRGRRHA
ncbi:MAG TPA: YcnI family protein [Acidimicrobiales bacterium]|nr:YcnI family protein [Acidimicrobiales bacterium]